MNTYILDNCQAFVNQKLSKASIYIKNGVIQSISKNPIIKKNVKVYDCTGLVAIPGLIDIHTHLREPGYEYKETIKTGTQAAAHGGYTTICCMPNLKPNTDSVKNIKHLLSIIKKDALINVYPYATITLDRNPNATIVNFDNLSKYCFAFSNDGSDVANENVMLEAMKKAKQVHKAIVAHCEDTSLIPPNASVNTGTIAKKYHLIGIPPASEYNEVARDVKLAIKTKCQYHVCHISSWQTLAIIKKAYRLNPLITCEVTPHHLLLNVSDIKTNDGRYKMNPPLKSKKDQQALLKGIKDGSIQIIATDHAPHSKKEKDCPINQASFGIVGLDYAFPLLYTKLVKTKFITLKRLIELMSINPAKIFHLSSNEIKVNHLANLLIFNPNLKAKIDPSKFASKGKSTPFANVMCYGWPVMTICNGEIVYKRNN